MSVLEVTSKTKLAEIISNNKIVVIDFCAKWCGPCKAAAPEFEKLSNEYRNIKFVKVDIDKDENGEIAAHFEVKSLPIFVFIKDGKVTNRETGYSPAKVAVFKEILNKLNNV